MKPFTTFEELQKDLVRITSSLAYLPDGKLHKADETSAAELLDLACVVLMALAAHADQERVPEWFRAQVAGRLAPLLIQVRLAYESGQFAHVEDFFGWKRPPGHRDSVAERARIGMSIYIAVGLQLQQDKPQAEAFAFVAEQFGKSKSFIETIYREHEARWRMHIDSSLVNLPK